MNLRTRSLVDSLRVSNRPGMQADPSLRDYNAYSFARNAPAPTRRPWLFEAFAENQDRHGSHGDVVLPGQQ